MSAADFWAPRANPERYLDAQCAALAATADARGRGVPPTSPEAGAIVERLSMAAADAGDDVAVMRAHLRTQYDPRGARFWELVAIMRGEPDPFRFDDWRWLGEALRHHAA